MLLPGLPVHWVWKNQETRLIKKPQYVNSTEECPFTFKKDYSPTVLLLITEGTTIYGLHWKVGKI